MTPIANILTDLYLSVIALGGLFILQSTLTRDDPITRRFLFGIRVTMLLFAGRALVVLTGGEGFRFLVMFAASLLPISVLVLTEGLLRRHAPAVGKASVAAGTVVFVFSSFLPADWIDPIRLWGLFLFQISSFALCGWLVINRDKSSLSGAENIAVVRLALSLVLFLPLIVLDFGTIHLGIPIQPSAIGVLTLCWLAITLGNDALGQRSTVMSFVIVFVIALIAGSLIGLTAGGSRTALVLGFAITAAAILLVMIAIDARRQRRAQQSLTILRHLAEGSLKDPLTFLRGLQGFPSVEGALIIEPDALVDLDKLVLERVFKASPVLRRGDPLPLDPEEREHVEHIFQRFEASHVLIIEKSPMRLVALAMPALASSPQAELELIVLQRMAGLISERAK